MKAGAAVAQLQRIIAMKEARLENWQGTIGGEHWVRADIAALRFALAVIDAVGLDEANAIARTPAVKA